MATPGAVAIFSQVTRAPSSMAIQMLEKHGGNLADAVNAYFLEEDTHKLWSQEQQNLAASASQHDNPGASNQDPLAQSSASHVLDAEKEEEIVEATMMQDSKTNTAGASSSQQMDVLEDSSDHELPQSHSQQQDDHDLARELFMSLKSGGISSEELNEALLAEIVHFGEISNHSSQKFSSLPNLKHHPEQNVDPKTQCLSTSLPQLLNDSRLLKQQQHAEYLEPLRADKQKELNSLNKAESHSSKEEESCKKEKELGKMLDKKEVRLPISDEVITIVVRMPDGGRCECCFHKTDKLELLFDFIDICGAQKPGTYRLVKSHPFRAYSINDCSSTFNEVGLSKNNEVLILELI